MLAVVTIVSIATFRMQPVYVAIARIELGRENSNILPFQGTDSYDYMMDVENYIETQSKILTSETLALQTIRNTALGADASSEAFATGSLANQKRPSELGAFLGSLSACPQQPLDGRELRGHQPLDGRSDRQRPHPELHRPESPQPL